MRPSALLPRPPASPSSPSLRQRVRAARSRTSAPAASGATETQADSDNPRRATATPSASCGEPSSSRVSHRVLPSTAPAQRRLRRRDQRVLVADRRRRPHRSPGVRTAAELRRPSPLGRTSAPTRTPVRASSLVVIVYAAHQRRQLEHHAVGARWRRARSCKCPGLATRPCSRGVELDVATGKWLVAIQGADDLNKPTPDAIAIGKQLVGALASK